MEWVQCAKQLSYKVDIYIRGIYSSRRRVFGEARGLSIQGMTNSSTNSISGMTIVISIRLFVLSGLLLFGLIG